MFAGQTYSAETYNGIWNVELRSRSLGNHSIDVVGWLLTTSRRRCHRERILGEMDVVDGLGPQPIEVQTPRTGSILSADEHEVTIVLSEEGGIDFESLRLAWWVEDTETGEFIREGDSPFSCKERQWLESHRYRNDG